MERKKETERESQFANSSLVFKNNHFNSLRFDEKRFQLKVYTKKKKKKEVITANLRNNPPGCQLRKYEILPFHWMQLSRDIMS